MITQSYTVSKEFIISLLAPDATWLRWLFPLISFTWLKGSLNYKSMVLNSNWKHSSLWIFRYFQNQNVVTDQETASYAVGTVAALSLLHLLWFDPLASELAVLNILNMVTKHLQRAMASKSPGWYKMKINRNCRYNWVNLLR